MLYCVQSWRSRPACSGRCRRRWRRAHTWRARTCSAEKPCRRAPPARNPGSPRRPAPSARRRSSRTMLARSRPSRSRSGAAARIIGLSLGATMSSRLSGAERRRRAPRAARRGWPGGDPIRRGRRRRRPAASAAAAAVAGSARRAAPPGIGPDDGPVVPSERVEGLTGSAHRRASMIAHSSSCSSGQSPEKCMPMALAVLNSGQSGEVRSRKK